MNRSNESSTPSGTTVSSPAGVKTYGVREFFRKPDRSQFLISPDGRHLSFLGRHQGRQNVFVQEIDARGALLGEARALTHETERDLAGHAWKGNDHILYVKDFGGDENFHVLSVPLDGSEALDLTPWPNVRASIVDDLEDDDRHVLISHNKRNPEVFDVLRVDVATGAAVQVAENPGNVMDWGTDHDGRLRIAIASDGVNNTLLYRDSEDDAFRPLVTTNFRESVSPLLFTFDNQRLYVSSNRGRDKAALFEFDPQTAQEGELVFAHDEVDVSSLRYSRVRRVLTHAMYTSSKTFRHFFDAQTEQLFADLSSQLPGQEVHILSRTRNERRMIVKTSGDRTAGAHYLYDADSGKLVSLGELKPGIDPADMAEMKPITFVSRDGLRLHGYLSLPVVRDGQAEARGLPLVVNPHGGPWARDHWGFNPEVQLLANRGYAVLQINFRGSTGYGRAFWEASFKQWGKTMQNDIDDGVDWLVEQGIVDPKRVAIYGGSYGGYATLAGVAFTPGRYAAAIDYVGVSNLFTLLETIPPYWKPMIEMLYEMVGNPNDEADRQAMHDASPVFFADRITTPLLVAQGANDPRVKQAESDQIVEALRSRGVDVEYLLKENEGHGFHNEENQFEFYEAMEAFLARHLAPRG
jgi:dipeptidyl aminopeptidase/acylaminoacyl peptidase